MSDTRDNAQETGAMSELPPLPDVTDTSYVASHFQAPPRVTSHEEEQSGTTDKKPKGFDQIWKKSRRPQLPDELYEAANKHFLSSYRNPLEEEVAWKSPKVRIPIIWWILFFLSLLASVLVVVVIAFFPELVEIPILHSMRRSLLVTMVFVIVLVGWLINFIRITKPPFWNKFHTIFSITCFLWGFGGISGISSMVVTAWVDSVYTSSDVHDMVSLILPISIWAGLIFVVPLIIAGRLLPVWERHAPLMRVGVANTFWGAYAGVILTLLAPYISEDHPFASFITLAIAVFPTAGILTAGVVVCVPIRWPISFTAYLNHVLGVLMVAFGVSVIVSYLLVDDMRLIVNVVLICILVIMAFAGLWAIFDISRASDPLRRVNLANLQTWVDADVISPDEHEFLCNEESVYKWGLTALRRGVFLAARDYYRAAMRLAFLEFGDEGAQDLSNVIRITRRKLEAAGIPPCMDFESFSEAPIYPDLLS